jgi:DnaK suppressor protein
MADVGHALERLDKDTYGWCESCGVPVPVERLEAIPWARLCVACPAGRAGWKR